MGGCKQNEEDNDNEGEEDTGDNADTGERDISVKTVVRRTSRERKF